MEKKRKTLQELTIMDNFLFGAVMMEEENCRRLLEIILNNQGKNAEDESRELVSFLEYTKKTAAESEEENEDAYIRMIQETIRQIKGSREMGEKYMTLQELLDEEREEGRKEGREEGRITLMCQLVDQGLITAEQGAEQLGVSTEEFKKKLEEYQLQS